MDKETSLRNSVIIGAHPDDELLWFTSILRDVDEIIVVYEDFAAQPGIGDARRRSIADYPRGNITSLGIAESGALGCADWTTPEPSVFGLRLGYEAQRRAITQFARRSYAAMASAGQSRQPMPSIQQAYVDNYHTIRAALRPRLRPDMNVFTHNPWGEYGHEEHVQLFRVLDDLRSEIGFKLWMSNYCTNRSLPLAMRYFPAACGEYVRLPADKDFARQVAAVYQKHGCWTWADDWCWFDDECFMEAPRKDHEPRISGHLFPLNMFTIDTPRQSRLLPVAFAASVASAAIAATALAE